MSEYSPRSTTQEDPTYADPYGRVSSPDWGEGGGRSGSVTTGEVLDNHLVVIPPGDSSDSRYPISPEGYASAERAVNRQGGNSSYAGSGGVLDIHDGDIEALLRSIFQESAQVSNNLLNVYAMQMESSNSTVDALTTKAESVMSLAGTVDDPGDEVTLTADFDYASAVDIYEKAGEDVPDWIRSGMEGHREIDFFGGPIEVDPTVKKSELESLSRMYTNAANSEQSNGQMIMNKLQTAQNRYDEAMRLVNSFESERHDLARTIAQS